MECDSVDGVYRRFVELSEAYQRSLDFGNAKAADAATDGIRRLSEKINQSPDLRGLVIKKLLDHKNEYVVLKAGIWLFDFDRDEAIAIMRKLRDSKKLGFFGSVAEIILMDEGY